MTSEKSKVKSQKLRAIWHRPLTEKNYKFIYLLPIAYCLLPVSFVFAFEEGGHDGGSGTIWRIVNFAILAVAVFLIVRRLKIKDFFANRRESIKTELEKARLAKEEAEKKVKEFEQKLSLLDKKIEEIYKEIRAEGEIEKKRIIEEALKLAEKIKEQARLTAEQEIKKAKEEIKREFAKTAVEMAEEILRSELTAADHERLIKEYLDKVRVH